MKTIVNIAFFALVAASQCAQAQADDVVRIVNRLRAAQGVYAADALPFVLQDALSATAARLARGASLDGALKAVGYRMTQVQVVCLTGEDLHPQLESLLAGRYCTQISTPALSEAGVYEEGRQMWIVLAAPFAPKVGITGQQLAERMLALVNEARAQPRRCGGKSFGTAPPLRWSEPLKTAASVHAADMALNNYFSHIARDGSTPMQRITRAGYRYRMSGENIAAGPLSPEEAVAGWIKSAPHCEAMMNGLYSEMGVAVAVNASSAMGAYWVQVFCAPL